MAEHAQAIYPGMRERGYNYQWSDRHAKDSPLSSTLFRLIADDEDLFALSSESQEGQLTGNMLISAVHYLLLRDPDQELAAYFPSIKNPPLPATGVAPVFKAFCEKHRAEITQLLKTHTLQTTAPGRAAQVLLALNEVKKAVNGPFSLIEIGCSAGLLLLFDQYRYEFDDGSVLGSADADVVISSCKLTGARPALPTAFPSIPRRVGLDLHPVNAADPDERNWILACIIPDRLNDFNGVRKVLDHRARTPGEILAGDAMKTLPAVLDSIDGDVCVFHSRCLYQWPAEAQEALTAFLMQASTRRTIYRVGIEAREAQTGSAANEITYTVYRGGVGESRRLGVITNKDSIEWFA